MPALDTIVLIRYLVRDDAAQLAAAERLIRRCVSEGQTLFVPVTVTLKLEWVLRSSFGYAKDATIGTLSDQFSAAELSFESERALEVALEPAPSSRATSPAQARALASLASAFDNFGSPSASSGSVHTCSAARVAVLSRSTGRRLAPRATSR